MSDISSGLGFSQSINTSRYAVGLYASEKNRSAQGPNDSGKSEADNRGLNKIFSDILDIGNSRGLTPSSETTLSIVEQKAYERLEQAFKADNVEQPPQDDYWSPENTAGRIVGFATNFYDSFAKKYGDSKETLDKFLGIVQSAIGEGIGQAETAIADVSGGSVPDSNRNTIGKTREHIDRLLQEFRNAQLARLSGKSSDLDEVVDNKDGAEAEKEEESVRQSEAEETV